jgi:hypothetical protein
MRTQVSRIDAPNARMWAAAVAALAGGGAIAACASHTEPVGSSSEALVGNACTPYPTGVQTGCSNKVPWESIYYCSTNGATSDACPAGESATYNACAATSTPGVYSCQENCVGSAVSCSGGIVNPSTCGCTPCPTCTEPNAAGTQCTTKICGGGCTTCNPTSGECQYSCTGSQECEPNDMGNYACVTPSCADQCYWNGSSCTCPVSGAGDGGAGGCPAGQEPCSSSSSGCCAIGPGDPPCPPGQETCNSYVACGGSTQCCVAYGDCYP